MAKRVSNYAPEMMSLLLKGSTQSLSLPLASKGECTRLRHRLHSLRNAMRAELHPNTNIVEGVQIRIEELRSFNDLAVDKPIARWFVIVEPADSKWLDAIKAYGLDDLTPELPRDEVPTAANEASVSPSVAAVKPEDVLNAFLNPEDKK